MVLLSPIEILIDEIVSDGVSSEEITDKADQTACMWRLILLYTHCKMNSMSRIMILKFWWLGIFHWLNISCLIFLLFLKRPSKQYWTSTVWVLLIFNLIPFFSSPYCFKIWRWRMSLLLTVYYSYLSFNDKAEMDYGNIAGKGEIAGNQHFLLFPQCFQTSLVQNVCHIWCIASECFLSIWV